MREEGPRVSEGVERGRTTSGSGFGLGWGGRTKLVDRPSYAHGVGRDDLGHQQKVCLGVSRADERGRGSVLVATALPVVLEEAVVVGLALAALGEHQLVGFLQVRGLRVGACATEGQCTGRDGEAPQAGGEELVRPVAECLQLAVGRVHSSGDLHPANPRATVDTTLAALKPMCGCNLEEDVHDGLESQILGTFPEAGGTWLPPGPPAETCAEAHNYGDLAPLDGGGEGFERDPVGAVLLTLTGGNTAPSDEGLECGHDVSFADRSNLWGGPSGPGT